MTGSIDVVTNNYLDNAQMVEYEFPLNERVRTLLRLENLIARMEHFTRRESPMDHHAALMTLLELMEVAGRADLKSDLLQELERQKRTLSTLYDNPEISERALDNILLEIESASGSLLSMTGKSGQHLRDNEWLMSIKQRSLMPGGTCQFDFPSYHYWLEQSANARRECLMSWLGPLLPLNDGLQVVLKLLRDSGKVLNFTAHKGAFQQMQGGRVAQLIRVGLSRDFGCIPEVGANKYAVNIRFIVADYAAKSTLFEEDVPFELTFCSIAS